MRILLRGLLALACMIFGANAANAQNFYCADAEMLGPPASGNPNFRVPLPDGRMPLYMAYQYYFHNGVFGFDAGEYSQHFDGVRAQPARGAVRVYADARGHRWTVTSLGGGKLQIQGSGMEGRMTGVACALPGTAPAMAARPASLPALLAHASAPVPPAGAKTFTYRCVRGPSFTLTVNVAPNGVWPRTILIQVAGEKPQTLIEPGDDSDNSTWQNENWEFYTFKQFTTLSDARHQRDPNRNWNCR